MLFKEKSERTLLFLTFSVLVANPKKTTLHGGQSRSWSAEQGKENKRKNLACTRYQYIFYLGTCAFVHGSLLYTRYAYMCNYSGMYVELNHMYDHHNWAMLPILLAVS